MGPGLQFSRATRGSPLPENRRKPLPRSHGQAIPTCLEQSSDVWGMLRSSLPIRRDSSRSQQHIADVHVEHILGAAPTGGQRR